MNRVSNTESLHQRIGALEARLRRQSRILGVVVGALCALFLMGQASLNRGEVVEAEAFVLRDSEGKERARLAIGHDKSVGLALLGQSGVSRAILHAAEDGTSNLILMNKNGDAQVLARVRGFGPAEITVANPGGNRRVGLSVGEDEALSVFLRHNRRHLAKIQVKPDQSSHFTLSDAQGVEHATVALDPSGVPVFRLTTGNEVVFEQPTSSSVVEAPQ